MMKPPVQQPEDHRSRAVKDLPPSVDTGRGTPVAWRGVDLDGNESVTLRRETMEDWVRYGRTITPLGLLAPQNPSVDADLLKRLKVALAELDKGHTLVVAADSMVHRGFAQLIASQGVDASLVEDLGAGTGSPTSRRGSHITDLMVRLYARAYADGKVDATYPDGNATAEQEADVRFSVDHDTVGEGFGQAIEALGPLDLQSLVEDVAMAMFDDAAASKNRPYSGWFESPDYTREAWLAAARAGLRALDGASTRHTPSDQQQRSDPLNPPANEGTAS